MGGLPQFRIDICEEEYELISQAYKALIDPHVDSARAEQVFDRTWLPDKSSRILGRDRCYGEQHRACHESQSSKVHKLQRLQIIGR